MIICVFKFSPPSPPTLGGTVLCVWLLKSPSIGGFRGQKSQSMTVPSIEAKRRQVEGIEFAGLVYGHQIEVSIGDCIYGLELIAKLGTPEEFINRVEYLPF